MEVGDGVHSRLIGQLGLASSLPFTSPNILTSNPENVGIQVIRMPLFRVFDRGKASVSASARSP